MTIFSELTKSVENMVPASVYHGWKMRKSVTKTNQWWFYAARLSTLFILTWILLLFGVMVLENISWSGNLNHSVRFLTSVNFSFVMLLLVTYYPVQSWIPITCKMIKQLPLEWFFHMGHFVLWQVVLHEKNLEMKNLHEINNSETTGLWLGS